MCSPNTYVCLLAKAWFGPLFLATYDKSPPHMGTTFFVEGVKNFFSCVHGSKMATGEVMFLAAIAWVKRGGRGGEKENF